ncbi:MAG TPA: hypothetical protein VGM27_30100, partial [Acidobacteriaceae bacterium]
LGHPGSVGKFAAGILIGTVLQISALLLTDMLTHSGRNAQQAQVPGSGVVNPQAVSELRRGMRTKLGNQEFRLPFFPSLRCSYRRK